MTTTTKLKGFALSAPEVRGVLAGTTTLILRAVRPQPLEPNWSWGNGHGGEGWYNHDADYSDEGSVFFRCPYGRPAERRFVQEVWGIDCQPSSVPEEYIDRRYLRYRAAGHDRPRQGWRPASTMPAWASRATLVNEAVSVVRLGELTEADAIAAGAERRADGWRNFGINPAWPLFATARASLMSLWDSYHPRQPWSDGLWVWAVRVRVEPAGA